MFSTLKNYSDKSLTRSDPTSNKTNLKVNKLSQKFLVHSNVTGMVIVKVKYLPGTRTVPVL